MKELFMALIKMLDENENVTEAYMYEGDKFAKITYETEKGKYSVAISKEKENGDL